MIAEHLNFTWAVVHLDSRDHFGKPDGNSSWRGGTLGAVAKGDADLSLNVWVQLDQSRVVDFTTPTRISCLTFMVPRPHILGSTADAVFQPLDKLVWSAWLLSIVVVTVAARLLDRTARRVGAVTAGGFGSLLDSFLVLLGLALVAYVPPSKASLGPQRHLITWWVVYSVLMTTAFSSGLIAHLTMLSFEPPINSAKEIVDHGLTWASTYVPNFHVMLNLENASEKRLADGMRLVDPQSWEPTVASGRFVVHGQKMDSFYFFWVGGNLGAETLGKMRLMRSCLAQYPVAIAVAKNSPLLEPFSRAIERIREAGLIEYWQRLVVRRKGRAAVRSLFIDTINRDGPQVLKVSQLWSAFAILLYGLAISTAAFILEVVVKPPEMHLKTI
ncbi:glutamate receptor [Thrips palmi]|uniref:Glutamate receptor n=1 Tax=Thrips palmi TaxID=161013 RepID=A0A6P9A4K2_THRPL|nr:glutamate receptor [Thrips palmi]